MACREVISHRVTGLGFGFYTPEETKQLSVKKITVPYVFDNLNQPIPDGLYDKAMGPIDPFERCVREPETPQNCVHSHVVHARTAVKPALCRSRIVWAIWVTSNSLSRYVYGLPVWAGIE